MELNELGKRKHIRGKEESVCLLWAEPVMNDEVWQTADDAPGRSGCWKRLTYNLKFAINSSVRNPTLNVTLIICMNKITCKEKKGFYIRLSVCHTFSALRSAKIAWIESEVDKMS